MDFKSVLLVFLPLICQISAQSGSSFYYYFSPKQPMIINSQTFGTNAQSHQRLLQPSANNPFNFNFNPSSIQNEQQQQQRSQLQSQNQYPTVTPFIPQAPRNAFPTIESIREKIAFTNAPAVAAQPIQYQQPQTPEDESPTSTFPGQPQPSAKLFNFLNQPFQFFQNSFNRFPQAQTTSSPPTQNYYTPQQQPNRFTSNTPQGSHYNQNHENFYNYYRGTQTQPTQAYQTNTPVNNVPYEDPNPSRNYNNVQGHQGDAVSYAVNQYYSAKNAQGPTASYSLTIGADPTTGPTATVHVSMGRPQDVNRFQHPRRPIDLVPQRFNNNQEQNQVSPQVDDISQSIEIEQSPNQDSVPSLGLDNLYESNVETETLTTTTSTSKPEVILMVVTAAEPVSTTTTTTTLSPETVPTTLATTPSTTTTVSTTTPSTTTTSSTTTTATTTTVKPTVPEKVNEFKTPKRIIIRKKIARKRIRFFNKNRTLTDPETASIQVNPETVPIQEHSIVTVTTTSEAPETTTTRRVRTRTRITSTYRPELVETTTSALNTLAPESFSSPSNDEISHQVTENIALSTEPATTTTPYSTTTEAIFVTPIPEESTTTNQPITESTTESISKNELKSGKSSDNFPIYDESDYEYYYNEGDTPTSNEVVQDAPIDPLNQSTPEPVISSSSTTTEEPVFSVTETVSSSTTSFPEYDESPIEEEIIEPLSTTEAQTITTSITEEILTETPQQYTTPVSTVETTSTGAVEENTESISITATTTEVPIIKDVSEPQSIPDKIDNKPIEMSTEKSDTINEDKTESSQPDYSEMQARPEAGSETYSEEEFKPLNATNNETTDAIIPEEENVQDFPDQYVYSQEEEYIDPHEDEKIKEAQRLAHQNAVKNIRNRLKNATTTTTETPDENGLDSSKKFIRKPTNVTSFPSSSSSLSSQNSYDDEETGDSRSQIIQKIQTFRTKLRRVASSRSVVTSSNSNSIRSTTKRPRRVTRPSDRSTPSTTPETFPNEEEKEIATNVGELNEVISNHKPTEKLETKDKEQELSPQPIKVEDTPIIANNTFTSEDKDSFSNVNYDVNELEASKPENKDTDVTAESDQPKEMSEIENTKNSTVLLVGELIIHEILPTQSTTTESLQKQEDGTEASTENIELEGGFDDQTDFQTYSMEDEIESSSQRPKHLNSSSSSVSFTTSEILSSTSDYESSTISQSTTSSDFVVTTSSTVSTTIEPSPELITTTTTSVNVETSTLKSDLLPQRKVKVILKRRKGAPPGSGTVARQVVRTRTRQRPKVLAA